MRRPLCLLCLTFVVVLVICMQLVPMPVPDYEGLDGQQLTVEGQIYRKEYKERNGSCQVLVLYLESVHILNGFDEKSDEFWKSHFQQFPNYKIKNIVCYVTDDGGRLPAIGESIRMSGEVRSFARATNPGEFDMGEYYYCLDLEFALENGVVEAVGGQAKPLEEGLYRWKEYFADVLERIFPKKEASIMKAILLGEKNGLDETTKELYRQSSIIHILSISGLHISMIGMALYRLLRKIGIPLKAGAIVSVVLIYGYGQMTGMSMSAARAIFMFTLHLLANMAGRTYDMLTALALAAVLLLIDQPRYIYNSGFWFSFGAVAAIGVLLPVLYEKAAGKKNRFCSKTEACIRGLSEKMKQAMASGAAVTLATLPVHLTCYYRFPLYSILLNLAVIPLMTILMAAGLFVILTGGWFPLLAKAASYADRWILWFYEIGCLLGSKIPGGVLISGKPKTWQVLVYLFMLLALVWQEWVMQRVFRLGKMPAFWKCQWILAALCILFLDTDTGMQITMLDVGQGDCIHIQSEEGRHYLIDGGSSTKSQVMKYQILPYLQSEGVCHLEAVFVSHADTDHCSGIMDFLEEYPSNGITVGSLILPDISESSMDGQYQELVQLAVKNGIKVQYMSRGQKVTDGEMHICCMHPFKGYETADANEYSLVLFVECGEFQGLFTGDVEGEGEAAMWEYMQKYRQEKQWDKPLTILKVAHHGSAYSTSEEMLEELLPRVAMISCGRNNSYGHPHEETLEKLQAVGSKIMVTADCGAITVEVGEKIKVYGFHEYVGK